MRIITWNVNGLRARLKAGFEAAIYKMQPDILCIQETRAKPEQLPKTLLADYDAHYSIHTKPGYAGATTFVKKSFEPAPFLHVDDFPGNDEPGRVSILDFKDFKLINSYTPNAGQKLEKLTHRSAWQDKLLEYIKEQVKPIIFCGDLNVAHKKIDTNCPTVRSGCSTAERNAHQNILNTGMVDIWRELNPDVNQYTWFSNTYDSREANKGMRIDAFIISSELISLVDNVEVIHDRELICGSDHNPVILDI